MRVTVDIGPGQGDEAHLHVATPDFGYYRPVAWLPGRLLTARPAVSAVADPAGLVRAVERCGADGDEARQPEQLDQLRKYGGLLFEAAFGDKWQEILEAVKTDADYLEVAVRGSAGEDHAALQALRWEALYDGTRFVAAQGTAYQGRDIHVAVVRLITASGAVAGNDAAGDAGLPEITHIPKVLFAVGSHLTDQDVRPGAEFMGIMRRLDRDGGSIQARVLERATYQRLIDELAKFKPDVLHLIGHGQRRANGQVEVQIRREPTGQDGLSADALLSVFATAGHWPAMAVLSVCQTARPDIDADSAPGLAPARVSALSFAARLVAGHGADGHGTARGVPVVVAMAGDISDTACRVFTQALTTSIEHGTQPGKAVTLGRGAAFYGRSGPVSGHWAMPTLFLADHVREDARLVNPARAVAARKRIESLGLASNPVFCGRPAFITALDRLLDGDDPLNVLVAYTPDQYGSFGGTRLLQELGARAVRAGVLPVLLNLESAIPRNLVELTREFDKHIRLMRLNLGLQARTGQAFAAATAGEDIVGLAKAIRSDLDTLVADLPADDPIRNRGTGQPRTILLCRRVDEWMQELKDLLDLLGPHGLQAGTSSIPVVLTGADVRELQNARETKLAGPTWVQCLPLRRFSKDKDEHGHEVDPAIRDEDILAYTWWLLNPPPDEPVYAPRRGVSDDWRNILRMVVEDSPLYPAQKLYKFAGMAPVFFTSGNDDALLASYRQVMQ
jgi:CHAT domain